MKLRLTPLNLITALGVALLGSMLFQPHVNTTRQVIDMGATYKWLALALIVVTIISDLIFRFTLKDLKKIWLVEIIFMLITAIIILILQKLN